MITVIRSSPFSLFYYWKKPVTDDLVPSCQNARFVIVIRLQDRCIPSLGNYENWLRHTNGRLITDHRTTEANQISIAFQHTEPLCLHPAVSSLGACPTPAR